MLKVHRLLKKLILALKLNTSYIIINFELQSTFNKVARIKTI